MEKSICNDIFSIFMLLRKLKKSTAKKNRSNPETMTVTRFLQCFCFPTKKPLRANRCEMHEYNCETNIMIFVWREKSQSPIFCSPVPSTQTPFLKVIPAWFASSLTAVFGMLLHDRPNACPRASQAATVVMSNGISKYRAMSCTARVINSRHGEREWDSIVKRHNGFLFLIGLRKTPINLQDVGCTSRGVRTHNKCVLLFATLVCKNHFALGDGDV